MKPHLSVITIGVDDLERALRFYRDGLGLATDGIVGGEFEYGAVVFIPLQDGLRLALWPRTSIARDSGLAPGAKSPTEFTLGYNVSSKDEVDAVMAQATRAVPPSSNRPHRPSTAGTPVTSRTSTAISGKSSGTLTVRPRHDGERHGRNRRDISTVWCPFRPISRFKRLPHTAIS